MNKLFGLFLLALACWAPGVAQAATCFWVGGTGSINDTTKWSNASGGSASTCAAAGGWPNSTSDAATFNASSGGGTVTRNVNWTVASIDVNAFTGTFGNSGDTATVNLNTFTNNGSGTRTVNLGASTWTCGVTATTPCAWTVNGATNLTLNGNTSTVVLSGSTSAGTQLANFGAFTYNAVTFNPDQSNGRGTQANTNNTAFGTLNIGSPNYLGVTNGVTWAVTNLNFTGGTPSITGLVSFVSSTINNFVNIALTNATSCSYCVWRDINVTTSTITSTNSIDLGHNSGVTITPPTVGGGGGGRIIGG